MSSDGSISLFEDSSAEASGTATPAVNLPSSPEDIVVLGSLNFGVVSVDTSPDLQPRITLGDGEGVHDTGHRVNPRLLSRSEYFATQFIRFGFRTDAQINFVIGDYEMGTMMLTEKKAYDTIYGMGSCSMDTIHNMCRRGLLPDLDERCSVEEFRRYAYYFADRLISYFVASLQVEDAVKVIAKERLRSTRRFSLADTCTRLGWFQFGQYMSKDKTLRLSTTSFTMSMHNVAVAMFGRDYASRFMSPISMGRFFLGILFTFIVTSVPALLWNVFTERSKQRLESEFSQLHREMEMYNSTFGNFSSSVILRERSHEHVIARIEDVLESFMTGTTTVTSYVTATSMVEETTTKVISETLIGAITPIVTSIVTTQVVEVPSTTVSPVVEIETYDLYDFNGIAMPMRTWYILSGCVFAVGIMMLVLTCASLRCCCFRKKVAQADAHYVAVP